MNPCVLFSGIPHNLIFRMRAEWIPPVYGIDSARIRNAFRRATEYCRNIKIKKLVCKPLLAMWDKNVGRKFVYLRNCRNFATNKS